MRKLSFQIPNHETLFHRWLRDRLAVIPVVYRQQKMMYDNNTYVCEDWIVSLEQPHIRPIQRGKHPNSTEFGQKLQLSEEDGYTYLEQTCWSNFNEGIDLEAAVEDYFRNSAAIPASFWRTESTRPAAIRCSVLSLASGCPVHPWDAGKPLRQTPKSSGRFRDACECSAIEGRNGKVRGCAYHPGHERQPLAGALAFSLFPFLSVLVPLCVFSASPKYRNIYL